MNIVVASNIAHARALAKWLELDLAETELACYGYQVPRFYNKAYLAYPLEGLTEDHAAWVLCTLKPMMMGRIVPMAPAWELVIRPPQQTHVAAS